MPKFRRTPTFWRCPFALVCASMFIHTALPQHVFARAPVLGADGSTLSLSKREQIPAQQSRRKEFTESARKMPGRLKQGGTKYRALMQKKLRAKPVLLTGGILILVDTRPQDRDTPIQKPNLLLKETFSASGTGYENPSIKRAVVCVPPKGGSTSFLEWLFLLSKGET